MSSGQLSAFNYAVQSLETLRIKNIASAYTVQANDLGFIINCTIGTFTVGLASAATLGAGFNVTIWNTSATAITVDPNGVETIDGLATIILRRGEGMQIVCAGTNWQTGNKKTMRGYAEYLNLGADRPIASGDTTVAIGFGANVSGNDSIGFGLNCSVSGASSTAVGRSATASGASSLALGRDATATSGNSTAIGQNSTSQGSQAVSGSGAMALGGSYASGSNSFAAAVANNTVSYGARGANSIAIGQTANASAARTIALGNLASATSTGAVCISAGAGGFGTTASGIGSVAIGERINAVERGKYAYGSGAFNATGDAQSGSITLRAATTDATATVLTSDQNAASTNNQVILPNNSAYAFTGTVVARQKAANGTASAAWKVEGLIRREANAGTTTLVASTVTAIDNTPGWTLALSADTTNGGLAVTFTGAAATNIRTVATLQTSEVTYA